MKKAAKVFILIEMILSGFLIYPIIFGIYALNKLDTAKTKKELTTASWLTFVFCSRVGGAFMLWLKDDDLKSTDDHTFTIRNMVWVMGLAVLLSVVLTYFAFWHNEENKTFFTHVLEGGTYGVSIGITILFAVVFLFTLFNKAPKFPLLKPTKILLLIISVALTFIYISSLIDSFCPQTSMAWYDCKYGSNLVWSWEIYTPSSYCTLSHVSEYNNNTDFPIIMTCTSAMLIASIIIFFIETSKTRKPLQIEKNKTVKGKITISPIEHEINNIKSLMDKGVIDEEEYKILRKGIIEKYSKN